MNDSVEIALSLIDSPDDEVIEASRAIFHDPAVRHDSALGALPGLVGVVVVGVVTVSALASHLVALSCRLRHRGIIVDVRSAPIQVSEVSHLPGGTVLVINGDGSTERYDVCPASTDLAAILRAATSR